MTKSTMQHKKKTPIFILAFMVIGGLTSGSLWLFNKHSTSSKEHSNSTSKDGGAALTESPTNQIKVDSKAAKLETFAQVQNVPNGVFNYGGSTSWAPLREKADPAIQAARPEFKLHYVTPSSEPPSSGAGIKMLIDEKVAFAESSRPISEEEYNQARQKGFKLEQIPVAIDGLAVAVNPNLNIPGLTLDQLKSIYTGKTTNWKQLGGPDIPIKPYSRSATGSGTVEVFQKDVLSSQPFGSNVRMVSTTKQGLQEPVEHPGGIYYASASEILPECNVKPLPLGRSLGKFVSPYQEPLVPPSQCPGKHNQLNVAAFANDQYPITRLLYVIVKQNGKPEQQAGKAYADLILTKQGQAIVSQAGLIKMR